MSPKRIIVHLEDDPKGKGISLEDGDTLERLVHRVKTDLFPTLSQAEIRLECQCAEVQDLGFILDLDHVRVFQVKPGEDHVRIVEVKPENVANSHKDDWVTLNIGGAKFLTCRSTFMKVQSGMLARMLASEDSGMLASQRDSEGALLIDRNPKYFEPILNFLRTGKLIIDHNVNVEGVYEEAKFYGVDHLIPQLEKLVTSPDQASDDMPLTRRDVIQAIIRTSSSKELRFQGVNLSGADLSKLDLRNINFKYAIFRGCNLRGANLSYCNLERSDLSEAVLDGALLQGIRMVCANLEKASLQKCTFEDPAGYLANMEGVNLRSANLEGSNMAGVNLRVATIKYGNMQNCDLRAAVLAGADLEQCNLSGSDLQDANLRGANLRDTTLELMMTPLHMSQTIR